MTTTGNPYAHCWDDEPPADDQCVDRAELAAGMAIPKTQPPPSAYEMPIVGSMRPWNEVDRDRPRR